MGLFRVKNDIHPGKYQPMISPINFNKVQHVLGRSDTPRPKKKSFTYRGLLQCGTCGRGVTAENKVNRFGSRYIYYHCSKRKPWGEHCREPSIEEKALEIQISRFLKKLELPKNSLSVINKHLDALKTEEENIYRKQKAVREKTLKSLEQQIEKLIQLRIRDQIGEKEYLSERQKLLQEKINLEAENENTNQVIEPLRQYFSYAILAKNLFHSGNTEEKRKILKTVSSNLLLKDKYLLIEAKKPFHIIAERPQIFSYRALVDDVRTYLHSEATYVDSLDIFNSDK